MGILEPDIQARILSLYYSDHRSVRSIAREVGVNPKTVRRLVRRREVRLSGKTSVRASILDPFKETILEFLRKDPRITNTALLNYLRTRGYTGGLSILGDFTRLERARFVRPREAYLRLEFLPGEVAQVDWGEFGDVFGDGIKIHCFAMVLAYSRMIYVEFTRSEKFEEFIRCHENAFKFFCGVPRECWYDNLTSAVSDRIGSLIRFNARFMAYMGHHSSRPHACNVARGNEKGRVEDLIKYLRLNFWSGRTFKDFGDLNQQLATWRNTIANQREHRITKRVVRILFENEEKQKLLPLNPVPYDTEEIFSRTIASDFHLQYETNRYSVPWTLVGLTVTVRVSDLEVKVFYNEKFICKHVRSYLKARVFTTESHRTGLLERKPGASQESWQLRYIKELGPKMAEYVELVRQGPRSLKYEISRLVALVTVYGQELVVAASTECLRSGIVGVDNLELYLKRQHHPSVANLQPAPIQFNSEKLNRVHSAVDLRKYDALYFEGDKQLSASEDRLNGDDDQKSTGGLKCPETQTLGAGDSAGLGENAGVRAGDYHQVSSTMDRKGKV